MFENYGVATHGITKPFVVGFFLRLLEVGIIGVSEEELIATLSEITGKGLEVLVLLTIAQDCRRWAMTSIHDRTATTRIRKNMSFLIRHSEKA